MLSNWLCEWKGISLIGCVSEGISLIGCAERRTLAVLHAGAGRQTGSTVNFMEQYEKLVCFTSVGNIVTVVE